MGRWQGDRGSVDCPFCLEGWIGDEKCDECDRDGIIECKAESPTNLFEGSRPEDIYEIAHLIFYSRERQWTPVEYGAQPAVFIQAYERFLGTVHQLYGEVQDRERNRREREIGHGRHIQNA